MKNQPQQKIPPFSIIIPIYNEEKSIISTLDDLQNYLKVSDVIYEIITVNDGSTDKSKNILAARDDIKVIEHHRNRGYGAALKTGINRAKYPLIVITDADGTYPNQMIPYLVSLAKNADMVIGARTGNNVRYSKLRRIPKWFLIRFAEWITNSNIPDLNSGLRVFHKKEIKKFEKILPDSFSFTTTITIALLTNNYIVHYEPIDYYHRQGKSKIKPIKDTLNFIQLILRTGLYFAPLKIFLPIAGIFFIGFLFNLYEDIFIRNNITERTLILLIAFTQTVMLALIADMLDKRT